MKINVKLIEERIGELGLTQTQFAEKTAISPRTVYNILQSGEIKKEEQIRMFAEVLELTIEELQAQPIQPKMKDTEKEDLYRKVIQLQDELIQTQRKLLEAKIDGEQNDRFRK